MVIELDEAEIRDIQRILEEIFITHIPNRKYFTALLNKWFHNTGISNKSCQKINNSFIKIYDDNHTKRTLDVLHNDHNEQYSHTNPVEQITKILTESKGLQNATRIVMALKSLLPQSMLYDRKELPFSFDNIIYGILSYDGPLVVICDFEKKQIVKGLFVKKEDSKGNEYTILKINEVLIEACPKNVIIYDDPLQIETKFEIEWITFTGKSIVIGPSTIAEMISILKLKALVLNVNLLENALISIFRSLVESGKAEFKDSKDISNFNMDIRKWIDNP